MSQNSTAHPPVIPPPPNGQPAQLRPDQAMVPISREIGLGIALRQGVLEQAKTGLQSYLDGIIDMLTDRPPGTLAGLDVRQGVPVALIFDPPPPEPPKE